MSRITLGDIEELRAKSEPLSTQIAGYVSSDQFKSSFNDLKPPAKSIKHRFSEESRDFAGSALKKSSSKPIKHKYVPLGTGRPEAELYPWKALGFQIDSPWQELGKLQHKLNGATENGDTAKGAMTNGAAVNGNARSITESIPRRGGGYDIARGLNYSHPSGSQPLIRFMTEHVELVHNPPYRDWSTCLTTGSTCATELSLRILCNRGDTVLTERYTYPGTLDGAKLVGVRLQGIEMDNEGLIPAHMEHILSTWDEALQGPRPKVLYTIPSGQNPTGATLSMDRKKGIYRLAEIYDLMIIEDDPYYFLRMDLSTIPQTRKGETTKDQLESASEFLTSLPASFLRIDTSGRVVRLDSTSKIIAPGLRAGWITSSKEYIDKFISYMEVSTSAPGGPSQLMLWHLLEHQWGHAGFFLWLEQLSQRHRARLISLMKACDKHLPRGLCTYIPPQNGMFLWVTLDLKKHLVFHGTAPSTLTHGLLQEIEAQIYSRALHNGVQVTKGSLFDTGKKTGAVIHLRLTSAAADEDDFDEGVRKLAQAITEVFTDLADTGDL